MRWGTARCGVVLVANLERELYMFCTVVFDLWIVHAELEEEVFPHCKEATRHHRRPHWAGVYVPTRHKVFVELRHDWFVRQPPTKGPLVRRPLKRDDVSNVSYSCPPE